MPNRDPRWLRASEAADLVGVDKSTLWRWLRAGRLSDVKTYRPGSETFYWKPDLEAFVRQRGGEIDEDTTMNSYDRDLVRDAKQRQREEEADAKRIAKQRDREEAQARGIKRQKPRS